MQTAARVHGIRLLAVVSAIVLVSVLGINLRNSAHARNLVNNLLSAETSSAPGIVAELQGYRYLGRIRPAGNRSSNAQNPKEKLHAAMAIARTDAECMDYLVEQIPVVPASRFQVVSDVLKNAKSSPLDQFVEGV